MIEQQAPPECQVSMNWTMIDGFGSNVQITMRGVNLPDYAAVLKTRKEFCDKAQESGWTFPGKVAPVAGLTAAGPLPASHQASDVAELSFPAQALSSSSNAGKSYFKVKGGRFTKFGVNIWPEVLAAAGLKAEVGPDKSLEGYTAFYVLKADGKEDKVIRLAKNGAPAQAAPATLDNW